MSSIRTMRRASLASLARESQIFSISRRTIQTSTTTSTSQKTEGDISAAFASLSGKDFQALDPRFAQVKRTLIAGHEDAVIASWQRLLHSLRQELPTIAQQKSNIIPQIDFSDLQKRPDDFNAEVRKRGVAVIRNVFPEEEALSLKDELREYIRQNPHTKAFPPDNPQVFELYWSPSQIQARSDPRLLAAQTYLMQLWHSKDENALVSSDHATIYADRLRMRLPGDAKFALGPHVDGGSCERWEPEGYGRGNVYDKIWQGRWEEYDPWESSCRLPVQSDLYQGVGACSMFRMFQGWLSLSHTGPLEGTLLVYPLLRHATAYFLLRPFFSPKQELSGVSSSTASAMESYLAPENWKLDLGSNSSWLHGATPGCGQELRAHLHPHLDLAKSMVHVPRVNPGDYVAWHCDSIHAVDNVHQGASDSSVMYIPACPLTVENAAFMARQRERFLNGTPSPDFGGGEGESQHVGRPGISAVEKVNAEVGMQAFGLKAWNAHQPGLSSAKKVLLTRASAILGFV